MDVLRLGIFAIGVGVQVLLTCAGVATDEPSSGLVRAWKAPPGEPRWKEDGFGPYAPSWPTFAVICRYAPHAPGAENQTILPASTLFLMSAPDLKRSNLVESIPRAARLAVWSRGDARGRWVRFASAPENPFFVLAQCPGGNCGDEVRIFEHAISYDSPHVGDNVFQDHTFEEVFYRGCVVSPLVGDVDGDGWSELLVKEMVSFGHSRAESEYKYRVIKLKDGKFQVIGDMEDAEVENAQGLSKL